LGWVEGLVSGVEGWGEKETAGRECVREGGGIFVGVETGWMGAWRKLEFESEILEVG